MSSSRWYTIHCAACQGHDFIGRPCRGRQISVEMKVGHYFTVDSLAAALKSERMAKWLVGVEPLTLDTDYEHNAAAIIKAAKDASE